MRALGFAFGVGFLGLVVGYLIFGQINGNYISPEAIFTAKKGLLANLVSSVMGIGEIREKILLSGAIGAFVGFAYGALAKDNR